MAYHELLGENGFYTVTDVVVHEDPTVLYLTIEGKVIETTPNHPFYDAQRGWIAADELAVGRQVRKSDGGYGVVEVSETVYQSQPMYNLSVEYAHTYFVGDGQWLVHNKCPHGNNLKSLKNTYLYQLVDKKTHEIFKHGITSQVNPAKRYTKKFMQDKWMVILDQGPRLQMRAKEAAKNFNIPGSLNRERTRFETVQRLGRQAFGN